MDTSEMNPLTFKVPQQSGNELVEVGWNDDDGQKMLLSTGRVEQVKKKITRFYAAAAAGQARACGAELVDFYTTASVEVSCWAS